MNVKQIRLDLITLPPELHRHALDAARLEELARSIETTGLLNPITVERTGDHFTLRAGHRRLEAHRLLRRDTIAANVREPGELAHGELITWAENLEREDLTPIEQAEACERMKTRGHLTPGQIAKMLRRSSDWVEERLALLTLPPALREHVHNRELPMRHAIELGRVTDDDHRDHLMRYALLSGASYVVIRDWVAQWRLHQEHPQHANAPLPPMPAPGERVVVLIPCLTCGEAHPPHELRAAHICTGCHTAVMEATEEWRRPLTSTAARQEENPAQQGGDAAHSRDERTG